MVEKLYVISNLKSKWFNIILIANLYINNLTLSNLKGASGDTIQKFIKTDNSVISKAQLQDLLFLNTLFDLTNIRYFTLK